LPDKNEINDLNKIILDPGKSEEEFIAAKERKKAITGKSS